MIQLIEKIEMGIRPSKHFDKIMFYTTKRNQIIVYKIIEN